MGFGREQGGRCWSGGTAAATVVLAAIPKERMGPEKSEKTVEGDEAHAQKAQNTCSARLRARVVVETIKWVKNRAVLRPLVVLGGALPPARGAPAS